MPGSDKMLAAGHTSAQQMPRGGAGLLHSICPIRSPLIGLMQTSSADQGPPEPCKGRPSGPGWEKPSPTEGFALGPHGAGPGFAHKSQGQGISDRGAGPVWSHPSLGKTGKACEPFIPDWGLFRGTM